MNGKEENMENSYFIRKITILLCFVLEFIVLTSYAQLTPYQAKVLDINVEYAARLQYNKPFSSLSEHDKQVVAGVFLYSDWGGIEQWMSILWYNYASTHPSSVEQLYSKYKNELKAAAKLKNKTDLEREEQQEKQKAMEKRRKEIQGTDYGEIIYKLTNPLSQFSKKGEFEKTEEWNIRLLQESECSFTHFCDSIVYDFLERKEYPVQLGEYNPDGEFYNFQWYMKKPLKLKVPRDEAPIFKSRMYVENNSGELESCDFFKHCFLVSREHSNFQMVNYRIVPKEIVFYHLEWGDINYYANHYNRYRDNIEITNEEEYDRKLRNPWGRATQVIPICVRENIRPEVDIEDVIIYFDDLGVDNIYLKGSSYNYTKQQFTPSPTFAKFKAEQEARQRQFREEQEKQRKNDSIFQQANNLLQLRVDDYHTYLKKTPYNFEKNRIVMSIPDQLHGENQRLSDTLNVLLDSVHNRKVQLMNRYAADSVDFAQQSATLQSEIARINKELLTYPYNLQKRTLSDSLSLSLFGKQDELKRELQNKVSALHAKQKQVEKEVYENTKKNHPPRFTEIWFSQNSQQKHLADSAYIECRCQYSSRTSFYMAWIDKTAPQCDCREKKFQEIKVLYHSREEFDQSYNKEESVFEQEVADRKKMWQEIRQLEDKLQSMKQVNMKKALSSSKPDVADVISKVSAHRNSFYYTEAIDLIFKYDEKLAKDWGKNGSYFKSQAEMYEIWIGEEYDKVLKARKKE